MVTKRFHELNRTYFPFRSSSEIQSRATGSHDRPVSQRALQFIIQLFGIEYADEYS